MSKKDKDIPSWQRSVFDKNSRVETKPITVKRIRQIEKDFYQNNKEAMKIKDPKLYEFYKAEFGQKKSRSKPKVKLKSDFNVVSSKDFKHEECLNLKGSEDVKKEDELSRYQKQREMERKKKLDQLKQHSLRPIKFETHRKDPHRGMGWVNSFQPINQGRLGHSQTWKMKRVKKYRYYE